MSDDGVLLVRLVLLISTLTSDSDLATSCDILNRPLARKVLGPQPSALTSQESDCIGTASPAHDTVIPNYSLIAGLS